MDSRASSAAQRGWPLGWECACPPPPPPPPKFMETAAQSSMQYCSLRFLFLFHEASLCPSDQDKHVCDVLKTATMAKHLTVGRAVLPNSQIRKLRPREAKGLAEPM